MHEQQLTAELGEREQQTIAPVGSAPQRPAARRAGGTGCGTRRCTAAPPPPPRRPPHPPPWAPPPAVATASARGMTLACRPLPSARAAQGWHSAPPAAAAAPWAQQHWTSPSGGRAGWVPLLMPGDARPPTSRPQQGQGGQGTKLPWSAESLHRVKWRMECFNQLDSIIILNSVVPKPSPPPHTHAHRHHLCALRCGRYPAASAAQPEPTPVPPLPGCQAGGGVRRLPPLP